MPERHTNLHTNLHTNPHAHSAYQGAIDLNADLGEGASCDAQILGRVDILF